MGGAYGAAGIGGRAGSTGYEGENEEYGTGKIIIKGGTIEAVGGDWWVRADNYHGGAGIGTGLYGIGGTIEILGGRITAAGGRETGAGIGGGAGGSVDKIVIGGARGKAPDITVSSYNNGESGYLGVHRQRMEWSEWFTIILWRYPDIKWICEGNGWKYWLWSVNAS